MSQSAEAAFRFSTKDASPDRFHVIALSGTERLSSHYRFAITLGCRDAAFEPMTMLGVDARLTLTAGDGVLRHLHGIVARVTELGSPDGVPLVELTLVPRVWRLGQRRDSRVFQHRTVAEIVAEVLDGARVPHRFQLHRTLARRDYCVQYQETDRAFVKRLLAEEGIFFHFEQPAPTSSESLVSAEHHEVVVFADAPFAYVPIDGDARLHRRSSGVLDGAEHVELVRGSKRIRTGRTRVLGYDYERPRFQPLAEAATSTNEVGNTLESYEHDRVLEPTTVEAHVARLRLEERRRRSAEVSGTSNCRRLAPGRSFELVDYSQGSHAERLVVVEVRHRGKHVSAEGGVSVETGAASYENEFTCLPADVPFRPRRARRQLRQVVETATVVGPRGEEIHVDELGRIKVQFHWDRVGAGDDTSSCWIRPMQPWAGAGWGTQFIPRIGMEVLVGFVGGDTDRPVVLGSLYNGANAPPFNLPEEKTTSGLRTRSTPGGEGHNELVFEDAKGAERVYVHAERDLDVLVENDRSAMVRGDESTLIAGDRLIQVAGSNTRAVSGDELLFVTGNLVVDVVGNHVLRVGGGSASHPRIHEAVAQWTEAVNQVHHGSPAREALDHATSARRNERDAAMLSAIEQLEGDEARAARILVRQVVDARDAERALGKSVDAALTLLDQAQDELLSGAVTALPNSLLVAGQELLRDATAAQEELVRRLQENDTDVPAIAEVQRAARADFEDTAAALERSRETIELVNQFIDAFHGLGGGEVSGGGGAPPGFASAQVQFSNYRDESGAGPNAKEVTGSMLDVKDAVQIKAGSGIRLVCGGSAIELTPGSITLKAPSITIDATGTCEVKGAPINLN